MKVAVTGGSGTVGRVLVRQLLDEGHEVVNLDVLRPTERLCRFIHVDLEDAGQTYDALGMAQPDAVAHLAANPRPGGDPRHRLFAQNVVSSHHVLLACADFGIDRVAVASSEMANGWTSLKSCPPSLPFNEDDVAITPNTYATGKLIVERLAESLCAGRPTLSVNSLRLNLVLNDFYLARIPAWRQQGLMSSHNFWSYVGVDDAARAFVLALADDRPGHRAYMVAADDTWLDVPTRTAIRDRYGDGIEVAEWLPEFGSPVDSRRIAADLGWRPTLDLERSLA